MLYLTFKFLLGCLVFAFGCFEPTFKLSYSHFLLQLLCFIFDVVDCLIILLFKFFVEHLIAYCTAGESANVTISVQFLHLLSEKIEYLPCFMVSYNSPRTTAKVSSCCSCTFRISSWIAEPASVSINALLDVNLFL